MTDLHCRMLDLQSIALLSLLIAHISEPGAAPGASRSQGGRSAGELLRETISVPGAAPGTSRFQNGHSAVELHREKSFFYFYTY